MHRDPPAFLVLSHILVFSVGAVSCQMPANDSEYPWIRVIVLPVSTKYETSALPSYRLDEEWAVKLNARPVIRNSYFACYFDGGRLFVPCGVLDISSSELLRSLPLSDSGASFVVCRPP